MGTSQLVKRLIVIAAVVAVGALLIVLLTGRTSPRPASPIDEFQVVLSRVRQGENLGEGFRLSQTLARIPGFEQHAALLRGAVELENGEFRRAYETLNGLQPSPELEAQARVVMGKCLYRLERYTDAAVCLSPLLENAEVAPEAHRWLAAIQYDLGNNKESLRHLDELIKLEPGDYRPHLLAGRMHADFKEHEQAIEHYSQALGKVSLGPEHTKIAVLLARELVEAERFAEALSSLNGSPETAEVLALQARSHRALGNQEMADRESRQSLSLDPDLPEALLTQAEARLAEGDSAKAVELLERLVRVDPIHYEGRYQLSVAYRANGRLEDARRTFDEVQRLNQLLDRLNVLNNQLLHDPGNIPLRREIAQLWRELGNGQMAAVWDKAAASAETFHARP